MAPLTEESPSPAVPLREMDRDRLETFSEEEGLSLSGHDLSLIRDHFEELNRDPTQVEVEVLAQTWSEHCKHRIFDANIEHTVDGDPVEVGGIFREFIRGVTEEIREEKPGFVLSAFVDNAGFIELDEDHGVCMKVETHNHPSAIEPYAGANTGIGGVIRDILGAGLGARPIGSVDVFCLGEPDTTHESLPESVIPPRGIFRGVVQGVRDYGNRMGIPTVAGAITFHENYTYNPLVFCGTLGVIPSDDIEKDVEPGLDIVAAGGLTGRDGLHGATFSSDTLSEESHEDDQGSVQIGNPIEEKKVTDFVLEARDRGLLEDLTDCGAGGYSSAVGEMLEETGGDVYLDNVTLKEEGLDPWEILLSESQERMVLAVKPENRDELKGLAEVYDTNCEKIGDVTDTERLRVFHEDELVCDLDCDFLHSPPRLNITSRYDYETTGDGTPEAEDEPGERLKNLLGDIDLCSRKPVIREYDHEVQGNTIVKPLGGPTGSAPADGVVLDVEGSDRLAAAGLGLLPEYGEYHPRKMGRVTVDEAIRQVVAAGADPDRVGILDNFSMGDPGIEEKLGELVETARGMSEAAVDFEAPFISGKDSFYNSFETPDGLTVSVPMTLVMSALGIVEEDEHALGTAVTGTGDTVLCLAGETRGELLGTAYGEQVGLEDGAVPDVDPAHAHERYQNIYKCVENGWIRAAHDLSEGGFGVALAEMSFGHRAGLDVDLDEVSAGGDLTATELLFSETGGRMLIEVQEDDLDDVESAFGDQPFGVVGRTTPEHDRLVVDRDDETILDEAIEELNDRWASGLEPHY